MRACCRSSVVFSAVYPAASITPAETPRSMARSCPDMPRQAPSHIPATRPVNTKIAITAHSSNRFRSPNQMTTMTIAAGRISVSSCGSPAARRAAKKRASLPSFPVLKCRSSSILRHFPASGPDWLACQEPHATPRKPFSCCPNTASASGALQQTAAEVSPDVLGKLCMREWWNR